MSQRLYRGKDIYSGEWVEGYYSKTNGWNCDDTGTIDEECKSCHIYKVLRKARGEQNDTR